MRKTLALSLLTALALAATTAAQMPPPGPDRPGEFPPAERMQPPGGPCGHGHLEGMRPARHEGPGSPGMRPQGPPPEQVLQEVLGLSNDQVAALKPLLEKHAGPSEAQLSQLRDAERSLAEALKAPNPDPAQVGALLLKVHAARQQVDPGEALRAALAKILTPAQKQKLAEAEAARAAEALRHLGI